MTPRYAPVAFNEYGLYRVEPPRGDTHLKFVRDGDLSVGFTRESLTDCGLREINGYAYVGNEFIGGITAFDIPERAANDVSCDFASDATASFWEECGRKVRGKHPFKWILIEVIEIAPARQNNKYGTRLLVMFLRFAARGKCRSIFLRPQPLEWNMGTVAGRRRLTAHEEVQLASRTERLTKFYERLCGEYAASPSGYLTFTQFPARLKALSL